MAAHTRGQPAWLDEMLQQMAAEPTGTAAPIHLQGEPMAQPQGTREDYTVTAPDGTEHSTGCSWTWNDGDQRASIHSWCMCGWGGPVHRPGAAVEQQVQAEARGHIASIRQGAEQHAAQFMAPEPKPAGTLNVGSIDMVTQHLANEYGSHAGRHLHAYAAKRAEWLQAKHDADVAQRALDVQRARAVEARRSMRRAEELADKAAAHRDEQYAAVDNLQGELLALVKDGA